MTATTTALDEKALQELEQKFDPEMRFRPLTKVAATVVGGGLIALSIFHYYTAGFGLLQEITHRGVHLAFVLALMGHDDVAVYDGGWSEWGNRLDLPIER